MKKKATAKELVKTEALFNDFTKEDPWRIFRIMSLPIFVLNVLKAIARRVP